MSASNPAHFGFVGQARPQHARQPDRLVGEAPGSRIDPSGVLPPAAVGGIDRAEDRLEPLRKLMRLGDLERDTGVANLRLRPHQALRHGRRRHKEGSRDLGRVEPQHRLQHERRMHVRIDRRMRADEQHLQPLVGNGIGGHRLVAFVGDEP